MYSLVAIHNLINLVYAIEEDFEELEAYRREAIDKAQQEEERRRNRTLLEVSMNEKREQIVESMWDDYQQAWRILGL